MRSLLFALPVLFLGLSLGAAACGSDDSSATAGDGGAGDDGTTGDGAIIGDGGVVGDGGNVGDGSRADGGGCGPYQIPCNGVCTNVNDPHNCGACGKTCSGGQVCSAGGCAGSCLPGLSPCNGTCVDTQSDSDNCGACGHACGAGKGCVDSQCVTATTFPTPSQCAGGGPPVNINNGDGGTTCAGNLGQTSFTWSVCSCTNADMTSEVLIDGWNSTQGPYQPGQLGGGLGANARVTASSAVTIWGQLWAGASTGTATDFSSHADVHADFQSGSDALVDLAVGKDAYVAGNLDGQVTIAGALHQPAGKTRNGVTYGSLVTQPVTVAPPCDCAHKVPVAAIVAFAKTHNDDALINLDPGILTGPHPARIDLPCGQYYITGGTLSNALAIVVHGRTAIFIDGDLTASAFLAISLANVNSELDVFVSGTITASSQIKLGSPNYPALARFYIGTTGTFTLTSATNIAGEVWAGYARVDWTSDTDMFGALFANDFVVTAPLKLHHDGAITSAGSQCPSPPPTTDGGVPPTACGSCKDCNNQACNGGTCGSCASNADCCAPLQCASGKCIPVIR